METGAASSPYGSARVEVSDEAGKVVAAALSVVLAGRNPSTGLRERVTVVTRQLPDDHVL